MAVIEKDAFYEEIVGYFVQRMLASYKSEPDKYVLETDHFEGHLRTVVDDDRDRALARRKPRHFNGSG